MLKTSTIEVFKLPDFQSRLLKFASRFDLACILDSHSEIIEFEDLDRYNEFDIIAGFANIHKNAKVISKYDQLDELNQQTKHWYLGYLSYDLKNNIENLTTSLPDQMKWPELFLFVPDILIYKKGALITYYFNSNIYPDFDLSNELSQTTRKRTEVIEINLTPRISKTEYLERILQLKKHIARGDIYEVNFCQEFAVNSTIDPYQAYLSLCEFSPSTFGAFLKINTKFLLSASPERFLKRNGDLLISQPIKGTAKRSTDIELDLWLKNSLKSNIKERSENIMIVDLVRNDLSRIANKGTVKVDELCEVYSFPQVHQMISTISAQSNTNTFKDIIKATFPMGSMTGAPKIEAMKIIERYESVKRGIYSGSVGYIKPTGDFDFNVVIRSLQYDAENNYVSYLAGSAITSLSDPEKEYEECLLKTYAIKEAFKQPTHGNEILK